MRSCEYPQASPHKQSTFPADAVRSQGSVARRCANRPNDVSFTAVLSLLAYQQHNAESASLRWSSALLAATCLVYLIRRPLRHPRAFGSQHNPSMASSSHWTLSWGPSRRVFVQRTLRSLRIKCGSDAGLVTALEAGLEVMLFLVFTALPVGGADRPGVSA